MADENKTKHRQAYQAATQALREEYPDRFNELRKREAEARGVQWTPRKSQAEKDAEQFERLLDEHPEFADRLAERLGKG